MSEKIKLSREELEQLIAYCKNQPCHEVDEGDIDPFNRGGEREIIARHKRIKAFIEQQLKEQA